MIKITLEIKKWQYLLTLITTIRLILFRGIHRSTGVNAELWIFNEVNRPHCHSEIFGRINNRVIRERRFDYLADVTLMLVDQKQLCDSSCAIPATPHEELFKSHRRSLKDRLNWWHACQFQPAQFALRNEFKIRHETGEKTAPDWLTERCRQPTSLASPASRLRIQFLVSIDRRQISALQARTEVD